MYESFFHLKEKPFDIAPNPAYLYLSRTHRQAMTAVRYGLQEQKGFVLMTGEVGSGKTTLVRELMRTLGPQVTFARIFNTRVSSRELLAMINQDFGLAGGNSKVQMLHDLNDFLIREYEGGRKTILIIDEAQNLTPDRLEEVRMLSNLETDDAKLLQILLVGQPELKRVLSLAELRQFRQRISIACHLQPLDRQDTELYILHRLGVAGNRSALAFSADAFDVIHELTVGIPRQINRLCDFLLLTSYAEERREVAADMVRQIAEEIGLVAPEAEERTAVPAREQAAPGAKGGSDGRRALLRALGIPLPPGGGGTERSAAPRSPAARDGRTGSAGNTGSESSGRERTVLPGGAER
jgi:general secretion pathway protein A